MSRVIVWVAEGTWRACVSEARALLPAHAAVTLVPGGDDLPSPPERAPLPSAPR